MTITSINQQPVDNTDLQAYFVQAAYRPIILRVEVDSATQDEPLFCDVAFFNTNGSAFQLFRTVQAYLQPLPLTGSPVYEYVFDLQDVMQEFLRKPNVNYPLTNLELISEGTALDYLYGNYMVECRCYLRTSSIDSNGAIQPQTPISIEPTASNPPTTYRVGTPTNPFFVFNASLRPKDRSTLVDHLSYRTCTTDLPFSGAGVSIYSMSNRPKQLTASDFEYAFFFPFIGVDTQNVVQAYLGDFASESFYTARSMPSQQFRIGVWLFNREGYFNRVIYRSTSTRVTMVAAGVYNLPTGLGDLVDIIPGLLSTITSLPDDCHYYRVVMGMTFGGGDMTVFASQMYEINLSDNVNHVHLRFLNALGVYESMTFQRTGEEHKSTSDEIYTNVSNANNTLTGLEGGRKRFNIRGQDGFTVSANVPEKLMEWMKDLINSPYILMQEKDPERAYTLNEVSFTPVVIEDTQITTRMVDHRFNYIVTLKLRRHVDYRSVRI